MGCGSSKNDVKKGGSLDGAASDPVPVSTPIKPSLKTDRGDTRSPDMQNNNLTEDSISSSFPSDFLAATHGLYAGLSTNDVLKIAPFVSEDLLRFLAEDPYWASFQTLETRKLRDCAVLCVRLHYCVLNSDSVLVETESTSPGMSAFDSVSFSVRIQAIIRTVHKFGGLVESINMKHLLFLFRDGTVHDRVLSAAHSIAECVSSGVFDEGFEQSSCVAVGTVKTMHFVRGCAFASRILGGDGFASAIRTAYSCLKGHVVLNKEARDLLVAQGVHVLEEDCGDDFVLSLNDVIGMRPRMLPFSMEQVLPLLHGNARKLDFLKLFALPISLKFIVADATFPRMLLPTAATVLTAQIDVSDRELSECMSFISKSIPLAGQSLIVECYVSGDFLFLVVAFGLPVFTDLHAFSAMTFATYLLQHFKQCSIGVSSSESCSLSVLGFGSGMDARRLSVFDSLVDESRLLSNSIEEGCVINNVCFHVVRHLFEFELFGDDSAVGSGEHARFDDDDEEDNRSNSWSANGSSFLHGETWVLRTDRLQVDPIFDTIIIPIAFPLRIISFLIQRFSSSMLTSKSSPLRPGDRHIGCDGHVVLVDDSHGVGQSFLIAYIRSLCISFGYRDVVCDVSNEDDVRYSPLETFRALFRLFIPNDTLGDAASLVQYLWDVFDAEDRELLEFLNPIIHSFFMFKTTPSSRRFDDVSKMRRCGNMLLKLIRAFALSSPYSPILLTVTNVHKMDHLTREILIPLLQFPPERFLIVMSYQDPEDLQSLQKEIRVCVDGCGSSSSPKSEKLFASDIAPHISAIPADCVSAEEVRAVFASYFPLAVSVAERVIHLLSSKISTNANLSYVIHHLVKNRIVGCTGVREVDFSSTEPVADIEALLDRFSAKSDQLQLFVMVLLPTLVDVQGMDLLKILAAFNQFARECPQSFLRRLFIAQQNTEAHFDRVLDSLCVLRVVRSMSSDEFSSAEPQQVPEEVYTIASRRIANAIYEITPASEKAEIHGRIANLAQKALLHLSTRRLPSFSIPLELAEFAIHDVEAPVKSSTQSRGRNRRMSTNHPGVRKRSSTGDDGEDSEDGEDDFQFSPLLPTTPIRRFQGFAKRLPYPFSRMQIYELHAIHLYSQLKVNVESNLVSAERVAVMATNAMKQEFMLLDELPLYRTAKRTATCRRIFWYINLMRTRAEAPLVNDEFRALAEMIFLSAKKSSFTAAEQERLLDMCDRALRIKPDAYDDLLFYRIASVKFFILTDRHQSDNLAALLSTLQTSCMQFSTNVVVNAQLCHMMVHGALETVDLRRISGYVDSVLYLYTHDQMHLLRSGGHYGCHNPVVCTASIGALTSWLTGDITHSRNLLGSCENVPVLEHGPVHLLQRVLMILSTIVLEQNVPLVLEYVAEVELIRPFVDFATAKWAGLILSEIDLIFSYARLVSVSSGSGFDAEDFKRASSECFSEMLLHIDVLAENDRVSAMLRLLQIDAFIRCRNLKKLQKAGSLCSALLSQFQSRPSIWEPWLWLTCYRVVVHSGAPLVRGEVSYSAEACINHALDCAKKHDLRLVSLLARSQSFLCGWSQSQSATSNVDLIKDLVHELREKNDSADLAECTILRVPLAIADGACLDDIACDCFGLPLHCLSPRGFPVHMGTATSP
eukprot:ANDGO_05130.mRNA.1 hypothetical protein